MPLVLYTSVLKTRYYQLGQLDLVDELRRVAKPEGVMGWMMTTTWLGEQPMTWLPTHQLVDFYYLHGRSCLFFFKGPAHMAPSLPFSRLIRHAGSYSGPILTPDPQGVNSV